MFKYLQQKLMNVNNDYLSVVTMRLVCLVIFCYLKMNYCSEF